MSLIESGHRSETDIEPASKNSGGHDHAGTLRAFQCRKRCTLPGVRTGLSGVLGALLGPEREAARKDVTQAIRGPARGRHLRTPRASVAVFTSELERQPGVLRSGAARGAAAYAI